MNELTVNFKDKRVNGQTNDSVAKESRFRDPFSNMISKPNKHPELKPIYVSSSQLFQCKSAGLLRNRTNMPTSINRNSQKCNIGFNFFDSLLSPNSISPVSKKSGARPMVSEFKFPPLAKKVPKMLQKIKNIEFNGTFGLNK